MTSKDRISEAMVVIAMVVGVFAIGSAPRWASCTTAALCLAAAAPLLSSRREFERVPPLLSLLLVMAALTAIQLVPLPAILMSALSPERMMLDRDLASAWNGDASSWVPISYAPHATLVELAKLAGYIGLAYACLRLCAHARHRRLLLAAVVLIAVAVMLTALLHRMLAGRELYGLYRPNFRPVYLSPLLNPNHLAAYMAIAVPLTVGLATASVGTQRAAWVGAGLLCGGMAFLTQSRAGSIAMLLGTLTAGGLIWLQRRRGTRVGSERIPRSVMIPAVIVAGCALVLLGAITAGGVARELSSTTTERLTGSRYKLAAWEASGDLIQDHLLTGVGRGGFEAAFTRVQPAGDQTYSHVENEYLQLVIDWGVPGAALLVILLAAIALSLVQHRLAGPLEAGALGSVLASAVHNAVDFNLELPGVALSMIAVISTLAWVRVHPRRKGQRVRVLRAGVMAMAAVVVGLAATGLGATAEADGRDFKQSIDRGDQDLVAHAHDLTWSHPSDYLVAGLAAEALARSGDPRAVKMMNYALLLNPLHSGLHHLAAQMLAGSKEARDQALLEYGLALQFADDPRPILMDMLARFPDVGTVARGLPTDPTRAKAIAADLVALDRRDVALAHARIVMDAAPLDADVAALVAGLALQQGEKELALRSARQAVALRADGHSAALYGRALSAVDRNEEAEAVLTEAIGRARSRGTRAEVVELITYLGEVQTLNGRLVEARDTLTSGLDLASERLARAAIFRRLATIESRLGNPNQAALELSRAERLDPPRVPPADAGPK